MYLPLGRPRIAQPDLPSMRLKFPWRVQQVAGRSPVGLSPGEASLGKQFLVSHGLNWNGTVEYVNGDRIQLMPANRSSGYPGPTSSWITIASVPAFTAWPSLLFCLWRRLPAPVWRATVPFGFIDHGKSPCCRQHWRATINLAAADGERTTLPTAVWRLDYQRHAEDGEIGLSHKDWLNLEGLPRDRGQRQRLRSLRVGQRCG